MTTADLAETLLVADQAQREHLLQSTEPADLEAAFVALGHRRDPAAAEVLTLADALIQDRALRKIARRELHRLRSTGIVLPETQPVPTTLPAAAHQPDIISTEAWVSDYDATGTRIAWLLAERRLGGVWFAALSFNDVLGIQEMNVIDTTRKRFERDFDESRRQLARFTPFPTDYVLHLVREAADLARENGNGVPTRYRAFRDVFGEADGPPERPLAFETINPAEATFNPDWLEQSSALLGEPEVAGWHVNVSSDFRTRSLEAARASLGNLLVPGHTPEQQALQVVADAAAQAITPVVRRGFRRRLEETASIFLATDRVLAARRAVAAARALEDEKQPIERHPLMRLLVASGLARLLGGESVGGRRAGEVFIDLVERAAEQSTTSPVETRPSGLILPR